MDGRSPKEAWPIEPPGIWLDVRSRPVGPPRPALFLDRDGVVIEDTGFVANPDVALLPGAAALVRTANDAGIPVIVVTNQSGIDRGLFGWDAFAAVGHRIAALLAAKGAALSATAACPFHPDVTAGYDAAHARYRKPGPGMIELAGGRLGIVPSASWLIGDRMRDCEAARAAGLAGAILLGTSSEEDSTPSPEERAGFRLERCDGLESAARLLATALFGAAESRSGNRA